MNELITIKNIIVFSMIVIAISLYICTPKKPEEGNIRQYKTITTMKYTSIVLILIFAILRILDIVDLFGLTLILDSICSITEHYFDYKNKALPLRYTIEGFYLQTLSILTGIFLTIFEIVEGPCIVS